MTINERIGLILREKNLTANEFAVRLEVRSSNISHIITGRNKPSFDFLEKLISVFPEINALWLIKGEGEMCVPEDKNEGEEDPEEDAAPEVVVHGLNRETSISMQTNLFGEMEALERPIIKPKKVVVPVKPPYPESEDRSVSSVSKVEYTKKISSIIVYYSNGNFEEFIPKS